jgi:hypothetical protein
MTIKTGIAYWCMIKPTTTQINVNIMFYQHFNNVFITSFTGYINSITRNVTIIVTDIIKSIVIVIVLNVLLKWTSVYHISVPTA